MILSAESRDTTPSIDLTPVIDMVFLLLIFFLVATTFQQTEREMKIALPLAVSAGPIAGALREIIVNVDAAGKVFVGGRSVSDDALATIVREGVARNPEQKVCVRGDRTTVYANVMRVLDICKGAGVVQPYLETVPAK